LTVNQDGEIAPGTVLDIGRGNHPLIGQPAPEIVGQLLDGSPVKLSGYLGQPVLINFWATWCPPCRTEMPWLEEVYAANKDDGLVLLAVDAGERVPPSMVADVVTDFATSMGLTFPIMLPEDPYAAQRQYQVSGLPSTFLLDKDGVVVDAQRGMFPNRASLDAFLQSNY
jgi:thiol-disulfide isomerase/thioredoxin